MDRNELRDRIGEIDSKITELKLKQRHINGTPTEVYTRIVGYYRNVNNFNRGKKEEVRFRKPFRPAEGKPIKPLNISIHAPNWVVNGA